MYRRFLCFAFVYFWPIASNAADLSVVLSDENGTVVDNAVVMFTPDSASPTGSSTSQPYEITQNNIAFEPFVTPIPAGASVTFRNDDSVLHHVFSFSKAKRFEIKLFGPEEPHDETFETPGVVTLGCNIHDDMIAHIFVASSPFYAQSEQGAGAIIKDVPPGDGTLTVWHPLLRKKGNTISQKLSVTDQMAPVNISAKFRKGSPVGFDY